MFNHYQIQHSVLLNLLKFFELFILIQKTCLAMNNLIQIQGCHQYQDF